MLQTVTIVGLFTGGQLAMVRMKDKKQKKEEENAKIEEMRLATRKRKEKADKKQSTIFTKVQLKQILQSPIKIDNSKTPTIGPDGNYYVNHDIDYSVIPDTNEKEFENDDINNENKENKEENKGSEEEEEEEEYEYSGDTSDDNKPREPSPEPIIELNEKEFEN
eukprot:533717_1